MRAYVAVTGSLFGLLVLVHVWHAFAEPKLLRDALYWLITVGAGVLAVWAWRLLRRPGA